MGAKPFVFKIRGYVIADTEANLWTAVDALLSKNGKQTTWALSGPVTSAAGNGIIQDIVMDEHGGEGNKWPFTIIFSNLGVD